MKASRCLYSVLELEPDATDNDIKKAFRKAALIWHPDKHGDKSGAELEEVNQRFLEVQEAWRVLSDPNEKAWYDEHREDILRGAVRPADGDEDGDLDRKNMLPNLWPFFSASCFSGFSASHPDNFYSVYQRAFEEIWNCEPAERRAQGFPSLGNVSSPWKVAREFYAFWTSFVSESLFAWADKWRTPDGESRDVRRQMKKENDKARATEKKQWQETVRKLASFCKGLDKRVLAEQVRAAAAASAAKEEAANRAREQRAAKAAARAARADEDEAQNETQTEADEEERAFWSRLQETEQRREEGQDEDENELFCAVCRKSFRSVGARDTHLQSRKHRDEVERLRQELALSGETLPAELLETPVAAPSSEPRKKNKKGKKGKKKQEDDDDEGENVEEKEGDPKNEENHVNEEKEDQGEDGVKEGVEEGAVEKPEKSKKPKKPRRSAKKKGADVVVPAVAADPFASDEEDKKKKSRRARRDKGNFDDVNRCLKCGAEFITRSALFRHLEEKGHAQPK